MKTFENIREDLDIQSFRRKFEVFYSCSFSGRPEDNVRCPVQQRYVKFRTVGASLGPSTMMVKSGNKERVGMRKWQVASR